MITTLATLEQQVLTPDCTYSRLRLAENCSFAYRLKYLHRASRDTTPPILAGTTLHGMIEHFFITDREKKRYGEPKYKTPKSFANQAGRQWKLLIEEHDPLLLHYLAAKRKDDITRAQYMRELLGDDISPALEHRLAAAEEGERQHPLTPIRWRKQTLSENKKEYFQIRAIIQAICKEFHSRQAEEGMPLASEFRTPVFLIDGIKLYGIIDEVRPLTIRDYKSRKWPVDDYVLKYDDQLTLYAGLMSIYASKNEEFAHWFGATADDISALREDPLHLLDKITVEHYWLNTGWIEDGNTRATLVTAPRRARHHFYEILERFHTRLSELARGNFMPDGRGDNCGSCLYKRACERYSDTGRAFSYDEQLELFIQRTRDDRGKHLRLPLEIELLQYPKRKRRKRKKEDMNQGVFDFAKEQEDPDIAFIEELKALLKKAA